MLSDIDCQARRAFFPSGIPHFCADHLAVVGDENVSLASVYYSCSSQPYCHTPWSPPVVHGVPSHFEQVFNAHTTTRNVSSKRFASGYTIANYTHHRRHATLVYHEENNNARSTFSFLLFPPSLGLIKKTGATFPTIQTQNQSTFYFIIIMTRSISQRNYNQSLPSSLCEQELVSCWFLSIWCPEENLDRSAFSLYQPPPQQVVVREQPPASEHQHTNYELNEAMEEEEEDLWPSIERTYSFDDWSEDENPNPTDSALEGGLMIPRSFTFDEWDSREDTEVHANGLGHSNPSDKVMLSNVPTPKETYLFRPIQHGRLSLDTTTSTSKTLSITTSAGSDCLPSIDTSSPCTTTPAVEECRGIQRCTPLLLDNSLDTTDAVSVESPEPAADYERQQYFPTFMYDLPHEEQEETTDNMAMQPPIPRVIYVPRPQQRRNNNNSQWRRQLVQSWRRMVAPRRDAAWKCPKPLYRRGHHFQQQHQQRFRRSGFQKTRKMGEF